MVPMVGLIFEDFRKSLSYTALLAPIGAPIVFPMVFLSLLEGGNEQTQVAVKLRRPYHSIIRRIVGPLIVDSLPTIVTRVDMLSDK